MHNEYFKGNILFLSLRNSKTVKNEGQMAKKKSTFTYIFEDTIGINKILNIPNKYTHLYGHVSVNYSLGI